MFSSFSFSSFCSRVFLGRFLGGGFFAFVPFDRFFRVFFREFFDPWSEFRRRHRRTCRSRQ